LRATQAYRVKMNPVSSFIEDRFERDENAPPYNADYLYAAYERYHEESTNRKWEKIPRITFTKKMQALGFTWAKDWYNPKTKLQEAVWMGLKPKVEQPAPPAPIARRLPEQRPISWNFRHRVMKMRRRWAGGRHDLRLSPCPCAG